MNSRKPLSVVGLLMLGTLTACGSPQAQAQGDADSPNNRVIRTPTFSVASPTPWQERSVNRESPALAVLREGQSASPGCPLPKLLVRDEESEATSPSADISVVVDAFNILEQTRRPSRQVDEQKTVDLPTMKDARLIRARYQDPSGREITTYDVLALSDSERAQHLFASGCAQDLPRNFQREVVESLRSEPAAPRPRTPL